MNAVLFTSFLLNLSCGITFNVIQILRVFSADNIFTVVHLDKYLIAILNVDGRSGTK